jgi:hypothetical protein
VLDFPYVTTAKDSAKRLALADFGRALRVPDGQQAIRAQGLRTHDGVAGPGLGPANGGCGARPTQPTAKPAVMELAAVATRPLATTMASGTTWCCSRCEAASILGLVDPQSPAWPQVLGAFAASGAAVMSGGATPEPLCRQLG